MLVDEENSEDQSECQSPLWEKMGVSALAVSALAIKKQILVSQKDNTFIFCPTAKTLDTDILQKLLHGCSIPQNLPENPESEYDETESETETMRFCAD